MTQVIAKYAARKMLSKEMDKYKSKAPADQYDPFYEMIENPKKPGKFKKVKKQIPAYIPEHDANILARSRKSAYRLDCCLFSFFGIRFGWSSVIGLIPAAGDALDAGFAFNLVRKMAKVEGGLPAKVLFFMMINLIVDFFIGLVPVVGDLADAGFRANSKNVRLFEEHLDNKYKPKSAVEADDAFERKYKRRPRPATVYEYFSDEEEDLGRRPAYDDRHDDVRQPTRAYSGRRDRVPDEEMGLPRRDDRPSRNNTRGSRR